MARARYGRFGTTARTGNCARLCRPAPCSTAPRVGWRCEPTMASSSPVSTAVHRYCCPIRRTSQLRPSHHPVGRSLIRPGPTPIAANDERGISNDDGQWSNRPPPPQLSRLGARDTQMGCFARAAERACSRSARARAPRLVRVVERGEALPREVGQTLGTPHGFSRSPGRPERPSPANSIARRTRPPSVTAGDQAPRSSIRRRLLVSGDRDGIGADLGRFSA